MKTFILLSLAAYVAASVGGPTPGECHAEDSCAKCVNTQPSGTAHCGWCAVPVTYATKTGPQCVDILETFNCGDTFQTDTCKDGYKCSHNGTGANTTSTCTLVPKSGLPTEAACKQSCMKPPPSPPTPPTPPTPKYHCNATSLTCALAKNGTHGGGGSPSMSDCQKTCKKMYYCTDPTKSVCKLEPPGTNGTSSAPYPDEKTCEADCRPTPPPYELRGIWRGFVIHNGYKSGEWTANITATSVSIWYPDATGKWKLYMKGPASAVGAGGKQPQGKYIITVASTAGKLTGSVKMLAADYSMNPEVAGFLQLAIDEKNQGTQVSDFDTAMSTATVISFEACPAGPPGPPMPPPAPSAWSCNRTSHQCIPDPLGPFKQNKTLCMEECEAPSPPPCDAIIDVGIVLDGSASITASDWTQVLKATGEAVSAFNLDKTKGAMITIDQFSANVRTEVALTDVASALVSSAWAGKGAQMQASTNTYDGFEQIKKNLDASPRKSTRKGCLVILMTDGKQNEGPPAKTISDKIKNETCQILGIGVGNDVSDTEIKSWVSTPTTKFYFKAASWSEAATAIKGIVSGLCPPPEDEDKDAWTDNYGAAVAGKMCKFHLPPNLPQKNERGLGAFYSKLNMLPALEAEDAAPPAPAPGKDPCNTFDTCKKCIAAHATQKRCGWCTGKINGTGTTGVCQGEVPGSPRFTCSGGTYHTTSCANPEGCGLKGIYRGLRIDNTYQVGEWSLQATGGGGNATSEDITINSLDQTGKVLTTVKGKVACDKKCSQCGGSGVDGCPFALTTDTGDILKGICGFTNQSQAETSGLMWGISNKGVATAPPDFDKAMNSTNSTVYTYYKCAEYKGGICVFKAP